VVTLISLELAKEQCSELGNDNDEKIERIRDDAEQIVADYLKIPSLEAAMRGSPPTLPGWIRAATLLVIEELFLGARHPITQDTKDPISPAVESLLRRSRDPAFA
jgi:hypothetical protein